jgi:hypothetical protein
MDVFVRYAPRLPALALLRARGHYINGDHSAALDQISDILRVIPGDAEPHLMQASILLMAGRPQAALNGLDAALTASFAIKAWPQFHVLRGRCLLIQSQVGVLSASPFIHSLLLIHFCSCPFLHASQPPSFFVFGHNRFVTQLASTMCALR